MNKPRLEAFSEGVTAIIVTIMVLEMKVPHGVGWAALQPLWPVFLSYVLSFIHGGTPPPVAVYGGVLVMAAAAWALLQRALGRIPGNNTELAQALGRDCKGKISPVIHLTSIALAFVHVGLSLAGYAIAAALWLIPDRRIERHLNHAE